MNFFQYPIAHNVLYAIMTNLVIMESRYNELLQPVNEKKRYSTAPSALQSRERPSLASELFSESNKSNYQLGI